MDDRIIKDENGNYVISPEVRREFYQHCLDIYTGKIEGEAVYNMYDSSHESLSKYGFCAIFVRFFSYGLNFELLPELLVYKPTVFYTCDGDETMCDSQFWYPKGQNKERIEILEEILTKDF